MILECVHRLAGILGFAQLGKELSIVVFSINPSTSTFGAIRPAGNKPGQLMDG